MSTLQAASARSQHRATLRPREPHLRLYVFTLFQQLYCMYSIVRLSEALQLDSDSNRDMS